MGLGLMGMQPIQDLAPETDCSASISSAVIDQHVAGLGRKLVYTSQGPVRGGIDAEQCAFGLCAVTRGHGNGHRPRQRQIAPYRVYPLPS